MAEQSDGWEAAGASKLQRPFIKLQRWLLAQRFFTSRVLPAMPRQVRWALRRIYFGPLDLIERFRPNDRSMVPAYADRFIGYSGDNFVKSGQGLVTTLVEAAGLESRSNVLDVGSGLGRLAIPLTEFIVPPGSYDGLDIVERGIRWCKERITPGRPFFQFTHANIFNAEYNPGGNVKASEYEFPYRDASFDVVCLFSVFTHMLTADVEHYVAEISRVLRPGGRMAATFLIIDGESRAAMRAGRSIYNFGYKEGPQWLFRGSMASPELAVAYEDTYVKDLCRRNGLRVDGLHLGSWRGEAGDPASKFVGQDLIVGVKMASSSFAARELDAPSAGADRSSHVVK